MMAAAGPGKVVLVTGGGSGLGAAICDRLVALGHRVSRTVRRPYSERTQTDQDISILADMHDHGGLGAVVGETVERFGRLDAVVFNAAVQGISPLSGITTDAWAEVVDVNVTAPICLAQAAVPYLRQTQGILVGISSVHAHRGAAGRAMYAASKAAQEAMLRSLASELACEGVRAVSLALGPFDSPALRTGASRFYPEGDAEQAVARFAGTQPLGRVGQPADIGDMIGFLVSPAGRFLSGTTLMIDGGQTSCLPVPQVRQ